MQKNKYIHTEKDKEDDIVLIKKFTQAFEDKFKQRLNLTVYNSGETDGFENYQNYICDDLLHNAENIYTMNNDSIFEMIWINTEINPNGVNDNLIARTFTIMYKKKVKEQLVKKFYDY